ncbi:MAG: putative bifunctional diguanylate cyclase/phosphodiesterase [Allosphingosinicella sp.]|uniref:putative bifunctional diguanylate cyclase/phosphodiesterase n=1 Tax=Allosphingosinicella sp. TaxID=2823234 RepID=UPI003946736B
MARFAARIAHVRRAAAAMRAEALVLALALATSIAIHHERDILERRTVFTPSHTADYRTYAYGDEAVGGGAKVRENDAEPLSWTCRLAEGHPHPFCGYGLQFDLAGAGAGIDMSRVDEIRLDVAYEGSAGTLKIVVKNRDRRAGRAAARDKVNGAEFPARQGRQLISFGPDAFAVPQWWAAGNGVAPGLARPQFDNVVAFEIQTGSDAMAGDHRFRIHGIELRSRLVPRGLFYGGLTALWLLLAAVFVSGRRLQAEAQRRSHAAEWRKTLDTIPQMVWTVSADGSEYFNRQWEEFTGTRVLSIADMGRYDLVHPDDRATSLQRWSDSLRTGVAYETEYRVRHRSGEYRWMLSRGFAERDENGSVCRWYGTCTDIHDRVLAQQHLTRSRNFTRQLVEATPDIVLVIEGSGRIVFANPAARQSLGTAAEEDLAGKSWIRLVGPDVRRAARQALRSAQGGAPQHFTTQGNARGGGRDWWDVVITPLSGPAELGQFLVISRNISHQKRAEERAHWAAKHDALTGLPNRVLLQQELETLTATRDAGFALLVLDVDEFKKINDTLGHDAGDAILCTFSERLRRAARSEDMVARLAGDEFAILLRGVRDEAEVEAAAAKIFAGLRAPHVHQGKILDCSTSIGASLFPKHGRTKAELLKNADVALYVAKSSGRRNLKIFNAAMRSELEDRNAMIGRARGALADDLILPFYQPKVELGTGRVSGFEALLRWRDPRLGLQTPDTIMAAFEDLSLAAEISDRIVGRMIADMQSWMERGWDFGHVAFNAAAAELRAADFAERLLDRLCQARIPTACVQMEVTETVFLGRGAEYVERSLRLLSANGVRIALDDFGTGYASLTHLKEFPVDLLKIDRSFVKDLQSDADAGAIVDAVIGLGKSLRIDVVAEGIETRAQHDTLLALGCRYGQGFLYSPAVAADEIGETFLRAAGARSLAA